MAAAPRNKETGRFTAALLRYVESCVCAPYAAMAARAADAPRLAGVPVCKSSAGAAALGLRAMLPLPRTLVAVRPVAGQVLGGRL